MTPFTVTAHLEAGVAHSAPWGIALDGLLAAQIHAAAKADLEDAGGAHTPVLTVDDPPDLPLPLARCTTGPTWHWAATCAWPVDGHEDALDVRYWRSSLDTRHVEALADHVPAGYSPDRGRYRIHWMPVLTSVCSAVVWRGVGDVAAVTELLTPLAAIGKKRSQGQGRVLSWEIAPSPDLDPWEAAHTYPDGSLGRPSPPQCLEGHHDVVYGGRGRAGLRAPYLHPARQGEALLPAEVHP